MRRFGQRINTSSKKLNIPFKEILLVVFGSIGGSIFTQIFYADNKIVDSDFALHKEINIQQFPLVNRLANFYWSYDLQSPEIVTRPNTFEDSNLLYRTIPRFIKDSVDRKYFLEDLEYFKANRHLIDATILVNLRPVQHFLQFYPLPSINRDSIVNSVWYDKEFQNEWHEIIFNLNESAYHFMHMGR
jgi:hypothetical protein